MSKPSETFSTPTITTISENMKNKRGTKKTKPSVQLFSNNGLVQGKRPFLENTKEYINKTIKTKPNKKKESKRGKGMTRVRWGEVAPPTKGQMNKQQEQKIRTNTYLKPTRDKNALSSQQCFAECCFPDFPPNMHVSTTTQISHKAASPRIYHILLRDILWPDMCWDQILIFEIRPLRAQVLQRFQRRVAYLSLPPKDLKHDLRAQLH